MARLEADAAGEVAAHASLAGQLKDLIHKRLINCRKKCYNT